MPTTYHLRKNYERQYINLCKETGDKPYTKLKSLSDFGLLLKINEQLIKLNCIPLTEDELEINLE